MPLAVWVGELSFGLVNIPVKLYAATSPKRVQFHQYKTGTGQRIRYRRVAEEPAPDDVTRPGDESEPQPDRSRVLKPVSSEENEPSAWAESNEHEDSDSETEIPWEEIVRGYEVAPGRVVAVEPEELESVAPERSRVLEVEQFVDLREIDPIYFEKSYYVVPQRGAATQRPYWLLYRAMENSGKVAIGRFVMRTKEYLVAVRPGEHVLILEALFYADEVRDPKEVWMPSIEEPSERELGLARQFLESLSGQWEPARHRDEHRERLLDLIQGKAGSAITTPEVNADVDADASPVIDLMEALRASVEAAKRAREEDPGTS
jgi:DNA end-binding protein Ku